MNKPELLVVVRHGESNMNIAKGDSPFVSEAYANMVKGIPDQCVPLTEFGILQAQKTGVALREQFGTFDVVYDSGYKRAVRTREEILKAYTPEELSKMKIRRTHLIRERERGYTFDMTEQEVDKYFPWLKDHYRTFGHFYSRPPGGQSQADLADQVYRFLGIVNRHRAGQKVLVVTHGHTIRSFRYNLEGWTPEQYDEFMSSGKSATANCSVTVYRHSPLSQNLELEAFNQVFWK